MDEMNIPPATMAFLLRQSYGDLITAAEKLGDKIAWSPNDKGRTAQDQLTECGVFAQMIVSFASGEPLETMDALAAKIDTPEKSLALCREFSEKLASLVETQTTDQLNTVVETPFGARSMVRFLMLCYWNNGYHEGQINYIATLI
jgi:hypothetical protein